MNRFIQKSWYTLTEAADYLTQNSQGNTKVMTSDILQLALDGEITLSIRITQAGATPLPFAELTLGDLSAPETERSKKLRENNPSHPLSDVLIFERGALNPIFLGSGHIYTGLWDIAFIGSGECFFGMLWNISQLPDAPSLDKLDSTIPKLPSPFEAGLTLVASNRDFALSVPIQALPEGSYLGVRINALSQLLTEASTNTERQDYPANLDALITAWRKHWKNADRNDSSTHSKKPDVKKWLMNQGFSDKTADAGATIITPDWKK